MMQCNVTDKDNHFLVSLYNKICCKNTFAKSITKNFEEKNVLDGNDRTINLSIGIFFSQKILLTVLVLEALFIGRVGILK